MPIVKVNEQTFRGHEYEEILATFRDGIHVHHLVIATEIDNDTGQLMASYAIHEIVGGGGAGREFVYYYDTLTEAVNVFNGLAETNKT